jgi:hypothetical protein
MAGNERLVGVSIDGRKRVVEVTTMRTGKGRHTHYPSLHLAPDYLHPEVYDLIRDALARAGYELAPAAEVAAETPPASEVVAAAGTNAGQRPAAEKAPQPESPPRPKRQRPAKKRAGAG